MGSSFLATRHDVTAKIDAVRVMARAYTLSTVEHAMQGAWRLGKLVSTTHDSFASSSHFPLSVVHLVASICLIVDDVPDD
jgi:hypothetical protein